ncbi:MAG: sterol-binding protein [Alphaproteobacteria bacterium]|nr:sterol-binding protein [Alphaproteobacteria bacterium]
MTLEEATQGLSRLFEGKDSGLGRTLKLDFGDDGAVYINARSAPNTVSNDGGDADTTISISLDNFAKLQSGELDGTQAFMSGALSVDGDLSGAMAFGSYTASQR